MITFNQLRWLSLVLFASVLATACGTPQAPSAPTALPTNAPQPAIPTTAPAETRAALPTPTATVWPITPSATPASASTIAPTITPSTTASATTPPISEARPDASELIFPTTDGLLSASADGTVRPLLSTDPAEFARNLQDALSPSGKWIAFVSGDDPAQADKPNSHPLTLNMLDMATGKIEPITPLFSADLAQAIRSASATGDRNDAIEAEIAIVDNGDTLKWSPDERYVAFIAAIDGPSSDVYSYDRETGQINRLTDGPNQAARLFWSPDSHWIIHEEVSTFGTGAGWGVVAVWAAAADGSGNRKLYNVTHSGDEVLTEWVSPDTFFVYSWTAIGWQNVRLINVTTGEVRRVGPDFPVQTLAYDPQTQTQLYYGDDFTLRQQGLTGGLYLSRPNSTGQGAQFITSGDWYETRWLPQVRLFFARGREGLISVGLDGRVTKYEVGQNMPAESPNGAWLLGWSYGEVNDRPGLRLYTSAGKLARTITSDSVLFATWSPDSMGAFYVSKGTLQYVTIPDGEPQMVAEKLLSSEPASYVWVRR